MCIYSFIISQLEMEILESFPNFKQIDLCLHAHFGLLQALIQEVDIYQHPTIDLMLWCYNTDFYVNVYHNGLHSSITL